MSELVPIKCPECSEWFFVPARHAHLGKAPCAPCVNRMREGKTNKNPASAAYVPNLTGPAG